ncbi:hypothetical protein FRC12_006860 [Ceratobasidium sp. 428]|nr:hypothetical protein FRC12_006860 [Ceratobasidium sp. 428]
MTDPRNCVIYIADPATYKEITRPGAPFIRDVETYKQFFGLFGNNLLTLEGDEWKNQRKLVNRAFTKTPLALVWNETMAAIEQLFELWDLEHGQRICVPHAKDVTKTVSTIYAPSPF